MRVVGLFLLVRRSPVVSVLVALVVCVLASASLPLQSELRAGVVDEVVFRCYLRDSAVGDPVVIFENSATGDRTELISDHGFDWADPLVVLAGNRIVVMAMEGDRDDGWDFSSVMRVQVEVEGGLRLGRPRPMFSAERVRDRFGDAAFVSQLDAVSGDGERVLIRVEVLREVSEGSHIYCGVPCIYDALKDTFEVVMP